MGVGGWTAETTEGSRYIGYLMRPTNRDPGVPPRHSATYRSFGSEDRPANMCRKSAHVPTKSLRPEHRSLRIDPLARYSVLTTKRRYRPPIHWSVGKITILATVDWSDTTLMRNRHFRYYPIVIAVGIIALSIGGASAPSASIALGPTSGRVTDLPFCNTLEPSILYTRYDLSLIEVKAVKMTTVLISGGNRGYVSCSVSTHL